MTDQLAVTWWGHSSTTVELAATRIGTDPVLVDRLVHLRRHGPTPAPRAAEVDLVLISHLHGDHLHVPSVRRTSAGAPIVVPRGAGHLLARLDREIVEVTPGERIALAGVTIDVLAARHDDRRHSLSRRHAPALGFRVHDENHSFWFPGDTGRDPAMADVDPVDLALVPIGGWGPTLGDAHLDPEEAAEAVALVGARWALPVHHGTFWPIGLQRLHRRNHHRLFVTPAPRFSTAVEASGQARPLLPRPGERIVLVGGAS